MSPRVALVTGCGKADGIGQAIARNLAAKEISVVVADRQAAGIPNHAQAARDQHSDWQGVDALAQQIQDAGGRALAVLGDISEPEDADRLIAEAADFGGRLDILVNNAAAPQGLDRQDIEEIPLELWDQQMQVNLRGTYLMSRAAVRVMRRQRYGRIVNISSMAGVDAAPHSTAYSASKAGVLGLTRSLAMDVGPWGVTVNAVCPGLIGTSRAFLRQNPADLDVDSYLASRGRKIPVGRVGTPEDVAAAVSYLSSEQAGYVTAQTLIVDGGGLTPFPLAQPDEPA
ncbi:SDR family NAD(P)-dependent oxidoreductase [Nesterenkonia sp. NBAIMH1]|uniref:SDR family NAD(P)-dependent oxidoreductase n=1 Tax=Nesterenkonia sp. NBAIMH1 TaxID=2600320 RepID=UPI0011B61939|nr:SDR family oxidoreductase [Nesterenkonia sp. NBAIMH1]